MLKNNTPNSSSHFLNTEIEMFIAQLLFLINIYVSLTFALQYDGRGRVSCSSQTAGHCCPLLVAVEIDLGETAGFHEKVAGA